MPFDLPLLAAMFVAYFIGALPTAVIIARRIGGVNIFKAGSGNPGASNVYRLFGGRWATACLIVDVFKGYLPVWIVARFAHELTHPVFAQTDIAVMGWVGFAAFMGHIFSPFLKFRGGKGAATALGAMFALAPQATTLTLIIYGIALYLWRKFSLATLTAVLLFPLLLYFREGNQEPESLMWGLIAPVLLLITHRENIRRLLTGSELSMQITEAGPVPDESLEEDD